MDKETIAALVLWTLKYYGSDAGERAVPGSKARRQALHIADVITQWKEACERLNDLDKVKVQIHIDLSKEIAELHKAEQEE